MVSYYHITKRENLESIWEKGLIPNEMNEIFLFSKRACASLIAKDQCGLFEFTILKIKVNKCDLIPDMVAESTARWQWIHYGMIPKEKISLLGTYNLENFR